MILRLGWRSLDFRSLFDEGMGGMECPSGLEGLGGPLPEN